MGQMMGSAATTTMLFLAFVCGACSYDPDDAALATVLPQPGSFEPFYAQGAFDAADGDGEGGSARAPHAHGTFYKHRHPALVGARNPAAYGFRFDGGRRFNYD